MTETDIHNKDFATQYTCFEKGAEVNSKITYSHNSTESQASTANLHFGTSLGTSSQWITSTRFTFYFTAVLLNAAKL